MRPVLAEPELKILDSVVLLVSVDVVDGFALAKRPAKVFFHDEAVFVNALSVAIDDPKTHVAVFVNLPSTLPAMMVWSTMRRVLARTFFRAEAIAILTVNELATSRGEVFPAIGALTDLPAFPFGQTFAVVVIPDLVFFFPFTHLQDELYYPPTTPSPGIPLYESLPLSRGNLFSGICGSMGKNFL